MRSTLRGPAVLGLALVLAACSPTGGATSAPTTGPTTGTAATNPPAATTGTGTADVCAPDTSGAAAVVSAGIEGNTFLPASISAKVGDVITWTNSDGVAHGIQVDDGPRCTGAIAGRGTGSTTFSEAGTFPFHCFVHPSMKGTFTIS